MSFDISETLAPKSDQLDAVDLLGGPQTFTITNVSKGNSEQPVQIHLAEFPRVWRPGKSMRRVLAACWGTDASTWVGRRVTLYCDEAVRFGNDVVGGTRISHLSHIDKPRGVPLLVKRGKSTTFTVQPLAADAPAASPAAVPSDAIQPNQLAKLNILLRECGVTERDGALAYYKRVTGRDVDSSKALTRNEAGQVLSDLERVKGGEPNLLDPASVNDPALDGA